MLTLMWQVPIASVPLEPSQDNRLACQTRFLRFEGLILPVDTKESMRVKGLRVFDRYFSYCFSVTARLISFERARTLAKSGVFVNTKSLLPRRRGKFL